MQNKTVFGGKKHAQLMLIMVCSFIGVGFVSGAEIYEFFVRFGDYCYISIFVFILLCFLLVYKIINRAEIINFEAKIDTKQANDYKLNKDTKMYNNCENKSKNTFLIKNYANEIIVFLNVICISGAMFSGLKHLLKQLFLNNYFLLLILCFFITFVIVLIGVKGLSKVDIFVCIFVLIMLVCFVCNESFNLKTIDGENNGFENITINQEKSGIVMLISSISFASLYVFMNILQFEPLVASSGIHFSKRGKILFSFLFAGLLGIILFIFSMFLKSNLYLGQSSMPFLDFFLNAGGFMSKIFPFGLLICLLTTLITCLIGVKQKFISKFSMSNFAASCSGVCLAIVLSILPFEIFVSVIYPFLGVINFISFTFL